jgi:hypothetical protein
LQLLFSADLEKVYLHFYCENQEEMEYWVLLVAAADHVMKFGIECCWRGAAYMAPRSSQSLPFDQEGKMLLLLLLCPVSLLMNSSGAMMMTFGCVTLMQQLGVKLLKGSNTDHGEEEMKKKKKNSGLVAVLLSMIAAFRLSFPEAADSGSLLAQCLMKLQIHDDL